MERDFLTTAGHWREEIDCRVLTLDVEYYFFTYDQVLSMAKDILSWVEGILSDGFVVSRNIEKKVVSAEKAFLLFEEHLQTKGYSSYFVDAMAISPAVYNVTTYRNYMRSVRQGLSFFPAQYSLYSADYPDYWKSLFGDKKADQETIRQNVIRIFREEKKKHMGNYLLPDIQALFNATPYLNRPGYYYGTFGIDFSAFCLNAHVDEMAETFAKLAAYLSFTYVKLNARVMLQPCMVHSNGPYMRVFGANGNTDDSHNEANCTAHEWYRTYYLFGAEWFNAISPLARQHLPQVKNNAWDPSVQTMEGEQGTLILQSKKPISCFDISDALEMKRHLHQALFPGMTYLPFRSLFEGELMDRNIAVFPRSNWAIVPVFEDEISIVGNNYLVFTSSHQSK